MAKAPRKSLSVSGLFFKKLEKWCLAAEVPISAVVEILAARAIGMPMTELPPSVQKFVERIPAAPVE